MALATHQVHVGTCGPGLSNFAFLSHLVALAIAIACLCYVLSLRCLGVWQRHPTLGHYALDSNCVCWRLLGHKRVRADTNSFHLSACSRDQGSDLSDNLGWWRQFGKTS